MASEKDKPLGYFTRLGLCLKATWLYLPLAGWGGFCFGGGNGFWFGICLFLAGVHWYAVAAKGDIKKELGDLSKSELRELVTKTQDRLEWATKENDALKTRLDRSLEEIYADDLREDVLHEINEALTAYDHSPSPVRAVASLEELRRNLLFLGRDYFLE